MTPTKLPACVYRGFVENEDAEFACLCPQRESQVASLADCLDCPLRWANHFDEPPTHTSPHMLPPEKPGFLATAGQIVSGAIGTAQAFLGIDAATEAVIEQRYAVCAACEFDVCGKCTHSGCGCFIGAKIRVASQKCPQGLW